MCDDERFIISTGEETKSPRPFCSFGHFFPGMLRAESIATVELFIEFGPLTSSFRKRGKYVAGRVQNLADLCH